MLERISHSGARLIQLFAPPGFGKSTLARSIAEGSVVTCDCYGVSTTVQLTRTLLAALALESPGRATALAQHSLVVSIDETASAAVIADALTRADGATTMLVENGEHLARDSRLVAFLARAIAVASPLRRIIVCSRVPLSLAYDISPSEVFTIAASDLRFTASETAQILTGITSDAATVARVHGITEGWPLAVRMVRRLALEHGVDTALDLVREARTDDLQRFVERHVVEPLSELDRDMLVRCVAVGSLEATTTFGSLAIEAFLTREGPHCVVHPTVRAVVETRFGDECRAIRAREAARVRPEDPIKAATLFLAANENDAAANALETVMQRIMAGESPSPAFLLALGRLEADTVLAHPLLWTLIATQRVHAIHPRTWIEVARPIWESLTAGSDANLVISVFAAFAAALVSVGRIDDAHAAFERYKRLRPNPDLRDLITTAGWEPYVEILHGRVGPIEELRRAGEAYVRLSPLVSAPFDFEVLARAARLAGDEVAERVALDRAFQDASAAGLADLAALVACERAFAALVYGRLDSFEEHVASLASMETVRALPPTRFFLACAMGEPQFGAPDDRIPWLAASSLIVACYHSTALDDARAYASAAVTMADSSAQLFVQIAARSALAAVDEQRAPAMREEIAALRSRTDGSPAVKALAEVISARHRHDLAASLSLAEKTITIDGKTIPLFDRELQLLALLSLVPTATRDSLAAGLYPSSPYQAARTALRVLVKRTRARLRDDVIESTNRGYALSASVHVDLLEVERNVRIMSSDEGLDEANIGEIRRVHAALAESPGIPFDEDSELLRSVARRIAGLQRSCGLALARYELRREQFARALHYAHQLADLDPYDEPAHEVMIDAYLASGDRASAYQALRSYRNVLSRELGVDVSPRLVSLLASSERVTAT